MITNIQRSRKVRKQQTKTLNNLPCDRMSRYDLLIQPDDNTIVLAV